MAKNPYDVRGLGDWMGGNGFSQGTPHAIAAPVRPAAADFPIVAAKPGEVTAATNANQLQQILNELKRQNAATPAHIRSGWVTRTGITLDWSNVGVMSRVMMRLQWIDLSTSPGNVYFAFDIDGTQVDVSGGVTNVAYIQYNESYNFTNTKFKKIGLRMSTGINPAFGIRVDAVAYQDAAGDQSLSIA
jgi:hypothetical protein